MFIQSLAAYLHYLSFIVLIASLAVQLALFRHDLTIREARKIQKADMWYGLAALAVLITGLLRVIYFEKGWEYYFSNHIFIAKITLFLMIGLMSIYPTVRYLKWRKVLESGSGIILDNVEHRRIKTILFVEIGLAVTIPLLAALMARGIGFVN